LAGFELSLGSGLDWNWNRTRRGGNRAGARLPGTERRGEEEIGVPLPGGKRIYMVGNLRLPLTRPKSRRWVREAPRLARGVRGRAANEGQEVDRLQP
jgi:hypothetical protein